MGCGGSKNIKLDDSVQSCIDMLGSTPVSKHFAHKFRANAHQLKTIEDAYKSRIFGGSIFLPVGSSGRGAEKRDKENNLQEDISALYIDYLYGGGFYCLHNVRVNPDGEEDPSDGIQYMDIYLLVESIDQLEEMKKLKALNDVTPTQVIGAPGAPLQKGFKQARKTELFINDILPALNGYGRIVYFRNYGDVNEPQDNAIEFVHEGRFKNGQMDGYSRNFDGLGDGFVEVGFFKEGRVQGKYMQFKIDGVLVEYGIKDGEDIVKTVEIQDFKTRNLKSDLKSLEKSKKVINTKVNGKASKTK